MSSRELLRRIVLLTPALSALLTALLAWLWLRESDGQGTGWALGLSAVLATLVAGVVGLSRVTPLLTRQSEGMTHLAAQVERLDQAAPPLPRRRVGLREIDDANDRLAEQTVAVARHRAEARDAAADASHQLRTPLTALSMRLEEIGSTDDLEVVRSEVGVAMSQVERLTGVVDTLLTRAKGEGAPLPEISLDSVLAGLQREYQPAFTSAKRSMRIDGERGLLVRSAPADLGQILQTLIENALHHGAGTVEVSARRSSASVVVEVSDAGPGIPAAIAPHIFVRAVTSRGSGLGLGLARQLAERNGGRLELAQSRPAIFTLFLAAPPAR